MKLKRLTIENFGCYTHEEFDFGEAPLAAVFGANEAGKTTALNALRQSLFGIPHQTPYLTTHKMLLSVEATLSDGRPLSYRRKKSRRDDLQGTLAGQRIDSEQLSQILGDLDLKSYEQLFGFTLDELRQGEKTIRDSRVEDALSGGGIGGIKTLQTLRKKLDAELDVLYRSRRPTTTIHRQLNELTGIKKRLADTQSSTGKVKALLAELSEVRKQTSALKAAYQTALAHEQKVVRIQKALPIFRSLQTANAEFGQLDLPEKVDMSLVLRWGDFLQDQKKLRAEIADLEGRKKQLHNKMEMLGGDASVFRFEDEVEKLGHLAGEMGAKRRSQLELQERIDEARGLTQRYSAQIGVDAETSAAAWKIEIDPTIKGQLVAWSQSAEQIDHKIDIHRAKLDSIAAQLETSRELDIPLEREEVARLEDLGEQLLDSGRDLRTLQKAMDEARGDEAIAATLQRVVSMLGPESGEASQDCLEFDDFESVLPSIDEMREIQGKLVRAIQASEEQKAAFAKLSDAGNQASLTTAGEVTELSADSASNTSDGEKNIESRAEGASTSGSQLDLESIERELEDLRNRRDSILELWSDELSEPLLAASITPEIQRDRISELVSMASRMDSLFERLRSVGARSPAEAWETDKADTELANSRVELEQAEERVTDLTRQWERLFRDVGVTAPKPEQLDGLLADLADLRSHERRLDQLRRDGHRARSAIRFVRNKLIDLWPEPIGEEATNRMIVERVKEWSQKFKEQVRAEELRAQALQQKKELDSEVKCLRSERRVIESSFATWQQAAGPFFANCKLESVERHFNFFETARQEMRRLEECQRELTVINEFIEAFERDSDRLKKSMSMASVDIDPNEFGEDQQAGTNLESLEPVDAALDEEEEFPLLASGMGRSEIKQIDSDAPTRPRSSEPNERSDFRSEQFVETMFKQLRQARESKSARIRLDAELQSVTQRFEATKQKEDELTEKIEGLRSKASSLGSGSINESLVRAVRKAEELKHVIGQRQSSLDALIGELDKEAFMSELNSMDESSISLLKAKAESDVHQKRDALANLNRKLGSVEQSIASLADNRQAQENLAELSKKRGELVDLSEEWVLKRLSQELLRRAIERLTSEHEPRVLQLTRKLFSQLTDDRYVDIDHDPDRNPKFLVRSAEKLLFEPSKLSTATREQLYLAIRMAFISHFVEENESIPVLMDDCLVNFDDHRMRLALQTISDWSVGKQTIIFSCHHRVLNALAEIAPGTPIHHLGLGEQKKASDFLTQNSTLTVE